MSGPPRVRSVNIATEVDARSVLSPAGNKAPRKPAPKAVKKPEKPVQEIGAKEKELQSPKSPAPKPQSSSLTSSIMRQQREGRVTNFSMNASYSSDGASSSGSSSSGRARVGRRSAVVVRRKQCEGEVEKDESGFSVEKSQSELVDADGFMEGKKRCAWVTPNTDLCYAAFHDEEWGIPVHDDKKLFELLSLSGALAELTWPAILNKRHIFREIFLEFDPSAVSKLNVKKITAPGTPATSLLSELKIRGIIENARQMCKVIDEFGSFDKYIWNFVNQKPIVGQFRYPRQVPVKTSKAEVISKDLVRRGFRSIGPTVVYSFMQVAGLTNDHLISCFRFQECIRGSEAGENDESKLKAEKKKLEDSTDLG